ncbi:hypothetical protein [Paenibacillus sp. YN15]|uniref:hypothetical protein n=1 Tax=Paenibacillus sp. YN15 TaxID=1742774 RepID=UPI0011BE9BFA|nr:hypothetical protein [Paenibacillus sp. YN15]
MEWNDRMSYRFEALLLAIELFTQRFDTGQLACFSFDFVNEILTLNGSLLFIRDSGRFVMKKKRLYRELETYSIEDSEELRQLPVLRGHVLTKEVEQVLPAGDVERLQPRWMMPLIIDDRLHGFILSDGNHAGEFSDSDLILSGAVMRLINHSLENSAHLMELLQSNSRLDQKNFNLFAINQSTRVMLSELSLSKLHETATDIFSEVTTSKITAFGIVDPATLRLTITGFRDVLSYSRFFGDFQLRYTRYNGPAVLHIERDRELLEELFVDCGHFQRLEAEFIVLIAKTHIMGMVTLSKPVNDQRQYDDGIFELVESLANSAVVAISNAVSYQEADYQRASAQKQLRHLQTLNRLVKNVNEVSSPEELCYFTMKTLHLAFGLKKAFIALRQDGGYTVQEAVGFGETDNPVGRFFLAVDEVPPALLEGTAIVDYTRAGARRHLPKETAAWTGEAACLVWAPLAVKNRVVLMDDPYPLGFLVILETEGSLLEEEVLLIETVAGNIAPVLHQMKVARSLRENLVRDERKALLQALEADIRNREEYGIPFYVAHKPYAVAPFGQAHPLETEGSSLPEDVRLFGFDGHLFALSARPLTADGWTEIPGVAGPESLMAFPYPCGCHP